MEVYVIKNKVYNYKIAVVQVYSIDVKGFLNCKVDIGILYDRIHQNVKVYFRSIKVIVLKIEKNFEVYVDEDENSGMFKIIEDSIENKEENILILEVGLQNSMFDNHIDYEEMFKINKVYFHNMVEEDLIVFQDKINVEKRNDFNEEDIWVVFGVYSRIKG